VNAWAEHRAQLAHRRERQRRAAEPERADTGRAPLSHARYIGGGVHRPTESAALRELDDVIVALADAMSASALWRYREIPFSELFAGADRGR